jgi:ammonium transporter, Amt family
LSAQGKENNQAGEKTMDFLSRALGCAKWRTLPRGAGSLLKSASRLTGHSRFLIFAILFAAVAAAQSTGVDVSKRLDDLEKATKSAQMAGDNAWMLTSSALVLMMTGPGLALFYSGLVRRKNVLGTMMHSFVLMGVVTIIWALVGYSLAFAEGSPFIGSLRYMFLSGVGADPNADYGATVPHQTYMIYQLMFAIITPALISGAFAERMKFSAMLLFMTLWMFIVYFPMAHMVWGKGGFLNGSLGGKVPAWDFAGGTVVHITSGVSALVFALYIGKREALGTDVMRPNNLVLAVVGACLLWVGWFGFNAGSALAASSLATSAFVATHFATAAAALSWMLIEWVHNGKPSVLGAISGAVAGLVAITPASGFVKPMPAMLIGAIAGAICFAMVSIVKNKFGYDDALDAFGVHGVGGTVGAILTGVFATREINDLFNGKPLGAVDGNVGQILNNTIGAAIAWVLGIVGTLVILKICDSVVGIRCEDQEELQGLDLSMHGEEGYSLDS